MRFFFSFLMGTLFLQGYAQKELTLKDAVLKQWTTLAPERTWGLQWVPGQDAFVYQDYDPETGIRLKKVMMKEGVETELFHITELNTALGTDMRFLPKPHWVSSDAFYIHHKNAFYRFDTKAKTGAKVTTYDKRAEHVESDPSHTRVAYTIGNNLHLKDDYGKVIEVTNHEEPGIVSGQAVHRHEFGITKGIFWSPTGNKLAFYQMDETMVPDYPLLDHSTVPVTLKNIRYPMAGQKSHEVKLGVYHLRSGKTVWLETGQPKEQYLTCISWSPDEKHVFIALLNRDQNHLLLNMYDAGTGKLVRTVFEEKDEKYVEPEHELLFLPGSNDEFLWWSERDGYMHLYRYHISGKMIGQVTSGKWEVETWLGFGPKGKFAYVQGTANDGLDRQIYKVNLTRGKSTLVTKESGIHNAIMSESGHFFIDRFKNLSTPSLQRVIDAKGNSVRTIRHAPDPLRDYKTGTAEIISIAGAGKDHLHCRMIKPSHFDSLKKYPVLVYVYGGPKFQVVTNNWLAGAPLWMFWMAEQGYIVFTLDNRGSDNRGIKFEQEIFGNMGDKEMADQLAGVEYLKSLPYVDGNKMAVYGWSYGGFMAASLMLRQAGTFQVGVAGGAVTDWKYYEIMYGERYMDHPDDNKAGYEKARLQNYVDQLEGNLLLIHGDQDEVVVPQHIHSFIQECVDKETEVDYFIYPGHSHNINGRNRYHMMKKVLTYIIDKLGTGN